MDSYPELVEEFLRLSSNYDSKCEKIEELRAEIERLNTEVCRLLLTIRQQSEEINFWDRTIREIAKIYNERIKASDQDQMPSV